MPTTRVASVYADPPVYSAGQSARPYVIPGAATRSRGQNGSERVLVPAAWFFGGIAAGAAIAVIIARALLK